MEFGEILSTVGGGSGIAAVLYVALPKLADVVRARGKREADGTALAAELVRERADEHRECREEVAQLREQVSDLRVSVVASDAKHVACEVRANTLESVVAELRGGMAWMQRQIEDLRRDSNRPTQEPAE